MKVTLATPGASPETVEIDMEEGSMIRNMKTLLEPHFGDNLKLLGKKKQVMMTLADNEKVPSRIIVHGAKTFQGVSLPGVLNKEKALELQRDLKMVFEEADFQSRLKDVDRKSPTFRALIRVAQFQVLPKYGFESTEKGVQKMMDSFTTLMIDPDIVKGANELNSLLGLPLVNARPRRASDPLTELSLEQAFKLQAELYDGFEDEIFQMQLSDLGPRPDQGSPAMVGYMRKLRDLALNVQSRVLPKYGFSGDQAGVRQMVAAFGPHLENKDIQDRANMINDLLGMPQQQPAPKFADAELERMMTA